jgi:hypothetical protein
LIFDCGNYSLSVNDHQLEVRRAVHQKAVIERIVFAKAEEVSMNPKFATVSIEVTDTSGVLIATFQGMAYRKQQSLNAQSQC